MKPFKIHIPDSDIHLLKHKLNITRFPESPKNDRWQAGADHEFLKTVHQYWLNEFDWRKQESFLNQFPQFTERIDDLHIHFIYAKGKGKNNNPLLLVHGWPDSFWRFSKIIDLLTQPCENGDAFDVIVPSIPGYGFSSVPMEEGINLGKIAEIFDSLMTETLGYDKYFLCGGDWGSYICERMAIEFQENITALFLTNIPGHRTSRRPENLSEEEKKLFEVRDRWREVDGAYAAIMNTKPTSISLALNDSPMGLAAWILEKFNTWSDDFNNYTLDELLTNISIYWFTGTADSSSRLYYETSKELLQKDVQEKLNKKNKIPTGFAIFPKDLSVPPREFAERFYHVTSWKVMDKGGHFAAFEVPDLLADELKNFLSTF